MFTKLIGGSVALLGAITAAAIGAGWNGSDCCADHLSCCDPTSACCRAAEKPECCLVGEPCCEAPAECCDAPGACCASADKAAD